VDKTVEAMMLFLRSGETGLEISVTAARAATAIALAAYPVGALVLALGPDSLGTTLGGYSFILLSLASCAFLASSSLQRIVAEQASMLDEYELSLRHRAMSTAYAILSALALVGVLYAAIAADKGLWVPTTYDQFNGLFWGAFLYASVLPTAVLAWTGQSPATAA
jgi:uncharacterized membrane protein YiaA